MAVLLLLLQASLPLLVHVSPPTLKNCQSRFFFLAKTKGKLYFYLKSYWFAISCILLDFVLFFFVSVLLPDELKLHFQLYGCVQSLAILY